MRRAKYILLLLISTILLTGCNYQTYEYSGDDIFHELGGADTDEINAKGGKVIVESNQAFLEINEETKDYDTYSSGEHKISKKSSFYKYYFVNLKEVKDNKFGTEEPIKLQDEVYGELELNVYGKYDYEISNINQFTAAYVKVDPSEFLDIDEFVKEVLVNTIAKEVVGLDVKYTDLPSYAETIKEATINEMKKNGITCNVLDIQGINLTEDSQKIVAHLEHNNLMLKTYIQNTTWIASDGSELIFDKQRFNWYLNQNDHSDNVQYGDYSFYIDELAVDYITTDLKSYGVTRSELENLFASSDKYDSSNFVVFNINLEAYTINGTNTTVNKTIYWYGFLLNNNQTLQVVNMNTATYYNFTRKGA